MYILILIGIAGYGFPSAIATQEFSSYKNCVEAQKQLPNRVNGICVEK